MALAVFHFARWLAWQLGDHTEPADPAPARITVFSDGHVS